MATINLTIPDAVIQRVLDAYTATYNYDASSGLTPAQFTKAKVADQIKAVVTEYEASKAAAEAGIAARDDVRNNVVIT